MLFQTPLFEVTFVSRFRLLCALWFMLNYAQRKCNEEYQIHEVHQRKLKYKAITYELGELLREVYFLREEVRIITWYDLEFFSNNTVYP